jgi:hypothetical protein
MCTPKKLEREDSKATTYANKGQRPGHSMPTCTDSTAIKMLRLPRILARFKTLRCPASAWQADCGAGGADTTGRVRTDGSKHVVVHPLLHDLRSGKKHMAALRGVILDIDILQ